jgi:hypothetical protein
VSEREQWLARARAVVDDARPLLARFGIDVGAALRVDLDEHPCPGYRHDLQAILFCPPVVEGGVDRLRWMFFVKIMGCADVAEARAFYDVALPLIICHELAHHLRLARGVADDSPFVEEQVCDRLAIGMIDELPAHRGTLAPLRAACERMRERLAAQHDGDVAAGLVPDVAGVLATIARLDADKVDRFERLAVEQGVPLETLMYLRVADSDVAEASAVRARAQLRVDSRYTDDPAEYWHFGLTWIAAYLRRAHRPALPELLRVHLIDRPGAERTEEVVIAVRGLLDDPAPARRIAGAEGLLELLGEGAVVDVAAAADAARDAGERAGLLLALAHAWPRERTWNAAAVAPPIARAAATVPRAALRLAGVSGVLPPDAALAAADARDPALAIEQLAAAPRNVELAAALADPERAPLLLDAWLAWGRPAAALPAPAYAALFREPSPLLRVRLWPLAAPAEAATILPPRGHAAWAEALTRLAPHRAALAAAAGDGRRAPQRRLRAAAALADLGDPDLLARLRDEQLGHAAWLLAVADKLAEDGAAAADGGAAAALAVEQLRLDARRIAAEIVRCCAPAGDTAAVHPLAERAADAPPPPALVAELLAGGAPADIRDSIAQLLAGRTPPGAAGLASASTLDMTALPAIVAAVLTVTRGGSMLTTVEKAIHLRSVPLFAHLEPARLWRIAEACVEQRHAAGDVIFREGDPGDRLYVIVSGRVQVDKEVAGGAPVLLADLGHPACFGEMALFDGAPRSATARCSDPCRLLTLAGTAFARVARENPEVYEALLRAFSARLRATSDQLAG